MASRLYSRGQMQAGPVAQRWQLLRSVDPFPEIEHSLSGDSSLSLSPQICLPVSFHVVRQEGGLLLSRNQRLQRAPCSPPHHKGSIVSGP